MLRKPQAVQSAAPGLPRSTRLLPVVVAWQVVIVAAALLIAQQAVWAYAVAALLVLVALLLTIPVNGRTLWATLGIRRDFGRRARARVEEPDVAADLVPLAQWLPQLEVTQIKDAHDAEIGVVADGESWSGILEVNSDNVLFTDRGAQLDLGSLGALSRQDDVLFAGIQVVTLTVPAPSGALLPGNSPGLVSYREIAGDATPPALRRTWIALRLDPRLCLEAVARRGVGQAGVFATLRFGLHRAQAMLKRQGMLTEPLDPLGIADVLALTSGAAPDHGEARTREEWDHWVCDSLTHSARSITSFGPSPSASYQRLLDVANASPSMMTLTSLTVSPGQPPRGALRLVSPSTEQAEEADRAVVSALQGVVRIGPRGGVQVPGMLATIPLGRQVDQ